ncbi:hypothetical protein CBS101457_000861 [Exobasidium rhododendri]|nr:hypothetical protein CBS101457_000861 [Exobasidium rhododendri]
MASPAHSSGSPWALQQHSIDYNGYMQSPNGVGDNSFDSTQSRQRRGSSPGKRALNWLTKSRSASPNPVEPPSPTSFVVRNVTKQPGGVSHGQQAGQDYHQMKSLPLAFSLGVPPGGPGGGVGYGTATSSNDGRPEQHGRGRSPSPTRPPSPGAIKAGAFRAGRISPGPLSRSQAYSNGQGDRSDHSRDRGQQQHIQQQQQQQSSSSPVRAPMQISAPSGPRRSPNGQYQEGSSLHQSSPLAGSILEPSLTTVDVNASQHPSRISVPVHLPPGMRPPPIIPLEGLPSPINIPSSPAHAGVSPLGSVSPGGHGMRDQQGKSPSSPNVASRWMKGLFGKSPKLGEGEDGIYSEAGNESQWMRQGISPNTANAPYSSKRHENTWSDGSPLAAGSRIKDEVEAEERKRHSMQMAARIEDQHRNSVMKNQLTHSNNQAWIPKQAIEDVSTEWDPPQSKSPPGRKPAPTYTALDLQQMSQKEREEVAEQVDPNDHLSGLEGRLTPAQQIIAETRSKQVARQRSQGIDTQVQRGFETEVQRRPRSSDTRGPPLPSKSPQTFMRKREEGKEGVGEGEDDLVEMPIRRRSSRRSPVKAAPATQAPPAMSKSDAPRPTAPGLTAGNGPMPKEMSISAALQEMMVRFYRFERYAVPLMRSMEARLVDVERDNQMALHGDAMSANSTRDREMDKWVGQMTGLMKHEVGQLQAATREIRQGRELLAKLSTLQKESTSEVLPSQKETPPPEQVGPAKEAVGGGGIDSSTTAPADVVGKQSSRRAGEKEDQVGELRGTKVERDRASNFSSSSFKSAIPVKTALDANRPNEGPSQRQQGQAASGGAKTSSNGRPKYTSILGRPRLDGKASPAVQSPTKDSVDFPSSDSSAPSPSPSIKSNNRRGQSVDDRLKALMGDSKSRSGSLASGSTHGSERSASLLGRRGEEEEEEEESDNTSFEKILSQPIGGDYQVVMARGASKASARTASGGGDENDDSSLLEVNEQQKREDLMTKKRTSINRHLQEPSSHTSKTESTIQKLSLPQEQVREKSSRRSQSGSRSYPASPNPSQQRQSTSPAALSTAKMVSTAPFASNGLRARAQSYLLSADGSSNPSTPVSPTPSPQFAKMDSSPMQIQPLRVHKGNYNAIAVNTNDLLGSAATTVKGVNNSTPVRSSIRDRVAFFDMPK